MAEGVSWQDLGLGLDGNWLSYAIPDGLMSLQRLWKLHLSSNKLAGPLPDAIVSLRACSALSISENRLSGSLPDAVSSLTMLTSFAAYKNRLEGWLPEALGHVTEVLGLRLSENHIGGRIPEAIGSLAPLEEMWISDNWISGAVPDGLRSSQKAVVISMSSNFLSGTIPWWLTSSSFLAICELSKNRFVGSLSQGHMGRGLAMLLCQGNMLEGAIPQRLPQGCKLQIFDISGAAGGPGLLHGNLPAALGRAVKLECLLAHHQTLCGGIPQLSSTLSSLALHSNALTTLPHMHVLNASVILLHHNLLSCKVPRLNGTHCQVSLVAVGNRMWYPGKRFPSWIMPFEQDMRLWASDRQGSILLAKSVAGSCLLALVWKAKLGLRSLQAISRWQSAPGSHGALARATLHQVSCMKVAALLSLAFLALLFNWDLYKCPQTLVFASACLRSSEVVHVIVAALYLRNFALSGTWMPHPRVSCSPQSEVEVQMHVKNVVWQWRLRCSVWLPVTLSLSSLALVHQAGKSVPGVFGVGGAVTKVISLCIGCCQSVLCSMVIPGLVKRISPDMRCVEGVLSLLTSCMIPALTVIFLDNACLQFWTAVWSECAGTQTAAFKQRVEIDVPFNSETGSQRRPFSMDVLSGNDVCKLQKQVSPSICLQATLLSMQETWLDKWITSGLILPIKSILRGPPRTQPMTVLQNMALPLQFLIIASAPLPLLAPVLLVVTLSEALMAAISWEKRVLRSPARAESTTSEASWAMALMSAVSVSAAFARGYPFASLMLVFIVAHLRWRMLSGIL